MIAGACADKKALDIVIMNMRKMSGVSDYFIIASGTSTTHLRALSDNIVERLMDKGRKLRHSEGEREALPRNVRDHEPAVALFAGGDGLDAFRRLAAGVPGRLKSGGALIVEVGFGQADRVAEVFAQAGRWTAAGRFKDLAGIDRVLQFTMPA